MQEASRFMPGVTNGSNARFEENGDAILWKRGVKVRVAGCVLVVPDSISVIVIVYTLSNGSSEIPAGTGAMDDLDWLPTVEVAFQLVVRAVVWERLCVRVVVWITPDSVIVIVKMTGVGNDPLKIEVGRFSGSVDEVFIRGELTPIGLICDRVWVMV